MRAAEWRQTMQFILRKKDFMYHMMMYSECLRIFLMIVDFYSLLKVKFFRNESFSQVVDHVAHLRLHLLHG